MCGMNASRLTNKKSNMTEDEVMELVDACRVVSLAYRNHPWFRMAFQDSVISVLREVDEGFSPSHYQTARRIAERVFDIE